MKSILWRVLGIASPEEDIPVTSETLRVAAGGSATVDFRGVTLLGILMLITACAPKEKALEQKSAPLKHETSAVQVANKNVGPAQPLSAPVVAIATEAERELTKGFISRFLAAIQSGDSSTWLPLHTLARRRALIANEALDKSYEAWRHGTQTVVALIAKAKFDLKKIGGLYELRFLGVMVPNDPETEYTLFIALEEGEMRISEK